MKKSTTSPSYLTICTAIGVVCCITICSTLCVLRFVVSDTNPHPHHRSVFSELQRVSMQLEEVQHRHHAKLDSVEIRLAEMQAMMGVLLDTMAISMEEETSIGNADDMKPGSYHHPSENKPNPPPDTDENGVLLLSNDPLDESEHIG